MSDRPILSLSRSLIEIVLELVGLAGIAFIVASTAYYWPRLPAVVSRHFNWAGEPDAWGSRDGILVLPAVAVILYVAMTLIGRLPHAFNYPWPITKAKAAYHYRLARTMFTAIKVFVTWCLAFVVLRQAQVSVGERDGLGAFFLVVVLGGLAALLLTHVLLAGRANRERRNQS